MPCSVAPTLRHCAAESLPIVVGREFEATGAGRGPRGGSLRELCIDVDRFFIFCRHTIREQAPAAQGGRASDRLHAHVCSLPPLQGVQHVH